MQKLNNKHTYFFFLMVAKTTLFCAQVKESAYVYSDKRLPGNYKSAYTDKAYIYEKQAPTFIDQLSEWFLKLLIRLLQNIGVKSPKLQNISIFFYVIIAAIAIYFIVKIILKKEGQWLFKRKSADNNLVYQTEVEQIETANFEQLISESNAKSNYRLSVKYYYLWTLQQLSEQGLIELNNLKTNADYQSEIENTQHVSLFQSISYYYNYVWYGEFEIDLHEFGQIEKQYTTLLNQLSK